MGCSRCLSSFPTEHFGDKPDYSNFDRSSWIIRDIESHKAHALHHRDCNTKSDRVAIERLMGLGILAYCSFHILIHQECASSTYAQSFLGNC